MDRGRREFPGALRPGFGAHLRCALAARQMLALVLATVLIPPASGQHAMGAEDIVEFFVAPNGDDAATGGRDAPFATLQRARDAIRHARSGGGSRHIVVTVRGGTYYLAGTLVLGPEDSGSADAPVVWRSAPSEEAILSGGRAITTHWSTRDGKIYFTDIPEAGNGKWRFSELFVNERRAVKARYPNYLANDPDGKSWLYVGGGTHDRVTAGLARAGDFAAYAFEAPGTRDYVLWLGISCPAPHSEQRLAVQIDGKPVPLPVLAPSHGFRMVSYNRIGMVALGAGRHTIRIENISQQQEFRTHLGNILFTDDAGLMIREGHVPAGRPGEQRVVIRPEDEKSRVGGFSSIGFQSFFVEGEQPPDRYTIRTVPDRVKAAWAQDPEARIYVVAGLQYFNELVDIESIDAVHGVIRVKGKECEETLRNGNHFFVTGVLSELDTPGEWYLDSRAGRLYYWPLPGEDPNRSKFVAPRLTRLIEVAGDLEGTARARWIQFRGFTFEHSAAGGGYVALRTPADAAVRLNGAWNCTIADCRFRNIDAYGIWLHLDSCENSVDGNTIEHMGGGGVVLTSALAAYGQLYDARPAVANYAPLRNRFTRNHIHHGGEVRLCSAGFLLDTRPASTAFEAGNLIAFNYVHDMKRQGVFGFGNQGGNVVAYNHFQNLVTDSADAGAINFALMNNVTAPLWIRNNVIDGVTGLLRHSEGVFEYFAGIGIYLDWGTSHARVENNVVSDTRFASFMINGGSWNRVENNIFLNDSKTLAMTPDGESIGLGHRFTRNILANTTGLSIPLWKLPLEMPRHLAKGTPFVDSDHNLFWNGGASIDLPPVGTLAQWQQAGMDRGSIAANPRFASTTGAIALRRDSPAYQLGFHDIDARNAGLDAKTGVDLDPARLAAAHAVVRFPAALTPGSPAAEAKPQFSKTAQYMVYVRFADKKPNRSLAFAIRHNRGASRTALEEHLSLGRVPDPRWGIYLGTYEFAAGTGQGATLEWSPGKAGSLPAEILFLEKKWVE